MYIQKEVGLQVGMQSRRCLTSDHSCKTIKAAICLSMLLVRCRVPSVLPAPPKPLQAQVVPVYTIDALNSVKTGIINASFHTIQRILRVQLS